MSGSRSNHLGSVLMLSLAATVATCWSARQADARGGLTTADRWERLDSKYFRSLQLPPSIEARLHTIGRTCGASTGITSHFAKYISVSSYGPQFIALHFDQFRCDNPLRLCGPDGCRHQIFALKEGSPQLVFDSKVYEIEMTNSGESLVVNVDCASNERSLCPRTLIWRGGSLR